MISGNTQISVFDNQTGTAPFVSVALGPNAYATRTRTIEVSINETSGTAKVYNAINGTDLTSKMVNIILPVIVEAYSMTVIHL